MMEGCRAEMPMGMYWCVIHGAPWPSGDKHCEGYRRMDAARAQKRAFDDLVSRDAADRMGRAK